MSLTKNANKFKLTKTKKTKYIVTSLSGFIERQEEIKKTTVSKKETLTLLSALNFNLKLKFLCFNINRNIVPRIKHTPKAILL